MPSIAAMPPETSWMKHFQLALSFAVSACDFGP
jgi:hypothetical protein